MKAGGFSESNCSCSTSSPTSGTRSSASPPVDSRDRERVKSVDVITMCAGRSRSRTMFVSIPRVASTAGPRRGASSNFTGIFSASSASGASTAASHMIHVFSVLAAPVLARVVFPL